MPNQTMVKLGLLSKKSPAAVENMYNALMDQLKKSNPIYKAYDVIPEANIDAKNKKYGEFMAFFMKELKKKLGIDEKLEVEGYNPKGVIMESEQKIHVWAIFTWTDRDGSIDDELSENNRQSFEEAFDKMWNEYPNEIDTDGFDVAYEMTKDQYNWCLSKYNDYFTLEPEEIEEEVGSVSTSSMGSPTTADGSPAPYGSSAIYADRISMTSRGGQVGMPKPFKKKKKKIRESIEYIDNLLKM